MSDLLKDLLDTGIKALNKDQLSVFEESKTKTKCGLSLLVGFGKTLASLTIGLDKLQNTNQKMLIVCSKTLIANWEHEIKKFFGDAFKYIVLHSDRIKHIDEYEIPNDVIAVITTPNLTSKYYKSNKLDKYIIKITQKQGIGHLMLNVNNYLTPSVPLIKKKIGGDVIYGTSWGCLIIDEIHNYTNIKTAACQSLLSIVSNNRYVLSGTIFAEPKIEKILGYYCIINHPTFPKSIPDATQHIKSTLFKGYEESMIVREENKSFDKPILNEIIVSHGLNNEETLLYLSIKDLLLIVNEEVQRYKLEQDLENVQLYNSYILTMITYLRQSIVSPILPIATAMLNNVDKINKSFLSDNILTKINELNLDDWFNDGSNIVSSRLNEVIKIIQKHKGEKIIVFTEYSSVKKLISALLPKKFSQLTISSSMSLETRSRVIQQFNEEESNVFILTYKLGSVGLNLQTCKNMILVDLSWNASVFEQSIARIYRNGNMHKSLNIYYLISNSGLELALLDKNKSKLQLSDELKNGSSKIKIAQLKLDEVLKIIENDTNITSLRYVNTFKKNEK